MWGEGWIHTSTAVRPRRRAWGRATSVSAIPTLVLDRAALALAAFAVKDTARGFANPPDIHAVAQTNKHNDYQNPKCNVGPQWTVIRCCCRYSHACWGELRNITLPPPTPNARSYPGAASPNLGQIRKKIIFGPASHGVYRQNNDPITAQTHPLGSCRELRAPPGPGPDQHETARRRPTGRGREGGGCVGPLFISPLF